MNLVFNIARTYEYEFTSNNLIKSDMVIDRVAMKGSGDVTGVCLVLICKSDVSPHLSC